MQQANIRRIQKVYFRARKATEPARFVSFVYGAALSISLVTLIMTLTGWLDGIVSIDLLAMLIVLPVVIVFVGTIFVAITFSTDVLLLKSSIKKLRYGDWDFLCHVVLERPVRSKEVLSDPAVAFITGQLLRKLGYQRESQNLIKQAINQSPALASITFEAGDVLSATDETVLMTGLERMSKAKLLLRAWSNPRTRYTVIIVGSILLLIFYVLQFIKIVWWQH